MYMHSALCEPQQASPPFTPGASYPALPCPAWRMFGIDYQPKLPPFACTRDDSFPLVHGSGLHLEYLTVEMSASAVRWQTYPTLPTLPFRAQVLQIVNKLDQASL